MIARNLQEQFDAAFVVRSHFQSGGVVRYQYNNRLWSLAAKFAQSLLLASSEAQVVELIRERPKEAGAFLCILDEVLEELSAAGVGISGVPNTPLLLYSPAAEVVEVAVRAYRRKLPYLEFLRQQHEESGQRRVA